MSGKKSRDKGKRGEREVAKILRDYGIDAQRGVQYSGGNDSPDVKHNLDGFHFEVKFTEKLSLYKAMEQAKNDCKDTDCPVVVHRASRKEWLAIMPFDKLLEILTNAKRS